MNSGTIQSKSKRIHGLRLRLFESLGAGGLRFGPDPDTLDILDFRRETDPIEETPVLFSGILDAGKFPSGHNMDACIAISQTDPLPCTVQALFPFLGIEDK